MSEEKLPQRKKNRLEDFDYSTPGAYFITICTENRRNLLGKIVGGGVPDAPQMQLSPMGKQVARQIRQADKAQRVTIHKYVIMPNHVHMILFVDDGASRTPPPTENGTTRANDAIPRFVAGWKRLCHQTLGRKIFQRSYHDHVIRGEKDYLEIWQYIDSNAAKWAEDCFYNEAEEVENL